MQQYLPMPVMQTPKRPQSLIWNDAAQLFTWFNIICEGITTIVFIFRLIMLLTGYVSEVSALDWVVIGGGSAIVGFKLGMAIYTLVELKKKIDFTSSVLLYIGLGIIGFNLILGLFFVLCIFLMGKKDPSGFLSSLFITASIFMGVEVLTAGLVVLIVSTCSIQSSKIRRLGEYLPVFQLVP